MASTPSYRRRASAAAVCAVLVLLRAPAQEPIPGMPAWTLDQARQELSLSPGDPYLHYVALQLARRAGRTDEVAREIDELQGRRRWRGEPQRVDLFDLFTGAHAVQESLQLDTMRGRRGLPKPGTGVAAAQLQGPTVRSHPWPQMLGDRRPEVSRLSCSVPEDNYLVEFRSLTRMLEILEAGDLWTVHLVQQAAQDSTSQDLSERLQAQLAIQSQWLLRPFYDQVVAEVGITGSDLYLREGSDVTLLFELRQPDVFRARMDAFLAAAQKARPDAARSDGELLGVRYVHLATPDRAVHVFAADPAKDLHVRSNSKAGLARVLAAIAGRDAAGRPVRRLGESEEFRYLRTLLPRGAAEEDGFVYLSDPFVRRIVGPEVKLTEARRMACYNHLRMIGHAALLHRTERGAAPASLDALADGFAPGRFGAGDLLCPDGGRYGLAGDGLHGACSRHGRSDALVPGVEILVSEVSQEEAAAYREFVAEYSRYWQHFFDPIAIRVHAGARRYRLETLVLPLIDNSVYTRMAASMSGEPRPLDATPVAASNLFSVALNLDPKALRALLVEVLPHPGVSAPFGLDPDSIARLVGEGLTGQVGLHVCDGVPMFDFSLPSFLGETMGGIRGSGFDSEMLGLAFLIASLNAPVYASLPLRDPALVDEFLGRLDQRLAVLARRPADTGFFPLRYDFGVVREPSGRLVRSAALEVGPIRWRFHWARIGEVLYVASRREILAELAAAAPGDPGPAGHALVRMRPRSWAKVLDSYQLGWADNVRRACLDNLGPLAAVGRALRGLPPGKERDATMAELARAVHGARFLCPESGTYQLLDTAHTVECSVHGTLLTPRQPEGLIPDGHLGGLLHGFGGLSASLTFLPEGLRAVLEVERTR